MKHSTLVAQARRDLAYRKAELSNLPRLRSFGYRHLRSGHDYAAAVATAQAKIDAAQAALDALKRESPRERSTV